ncbi:M28 family metallopeptidase [Edaphobacter sp. 4G125]|nr:M28 family metallopeptidase [Edaphobacter sp. 4G125]
MEYRAGCDTLPLNFFRGLLLRAAARILACPLLLASFSAYAQAPQVFGYRDFSQQAKWDAAFLAVPDAKLAGEHLKILTAAPHWASSQEDYATALYVADKFKAAGLETQIVPYKVLLNKPVKISIEAFTDDGKKLMSGPTPEHVDPKEYGGDPFQNDPRIFPAFNGSSPSGDVTGEVVYANYGNLADFKKLAEMGVSIKDKIVLVRYGGNFRGVKVYIAQQYGAKGVLIYSDPTDDGYYRGDIYPKGPYRPKSGVQRGSVQFLPIYPGDPQTPGIASTPDLPDSKRIPLSELKGNQPSIPANPISYKDAAPILKHLDGPTSPREWQGALPFTYHVGGTNKVTVHMNLEQDTALRTIWDVIGTIEGTDPAQKNDWVVAGNHRDAWVFGAVDPNSGTAAMLETVHGLGELLKQGWKPKRSIVIASWDAEEEGLMGSTEWAEQHAAQLAHAVAYFNTDVGVSGPDFKASAVPSLKQFVREVTKQVSSPKGGTVYEQWKLDQQGEAGRRTSVSAGTPGGPSRFNAKVDNDVRVGDLGSGSDYTPFIQHLGVPSTDIGSEGPYGVYHSAFDNYNWFVKFADPTFVYEQQQARVFGLQILHMANADVLPYDYELYGKEIVSYIETAQKHAAADKLNLDFAPALEAARRFEASGAAIRTHQQTPPSNPAALNNALRQAEGALLNPEGLPHRPWYKHTIYAPGEYTGYAAVVIPGVNEAISTPDATRAREQLVQLTEALNRAAGILESAGK